MGSSNIGGKSPGSINDHRIPGMSELCEGTIPPGILLLVGPAGSGKTMYCRQFLAEGLEIDRCILVSPGLNEKQFQDMFSPYLKLLSSSTLQNLKFINPYAFSQQSSSSSTRRELSIRLSATVKEVQNFIAAKSQRSSNKLDAGPANSNAAVRVVVDSLTYLLLLFGEKALMDFVLGLCAAVREAKGMGILTMAESDQRLRNKLSSVTDGIIEMKLEEDQKGSLSREIRLLSIKGMHHKPIWRSFSIGDQGSLLFDSSSASTSVPTLLCTLCRKSIVSKPIMYSDFAFDTLTCLETYRKLEGVYGATISEMGLPSEATNVSFFFIDIVGLSNPSLSVKKQIQKIEALNNLIDSSVAFRKSAKDKKITLPTGDGMAIGFLLNPELPLELAIELHQSLRLHNKAKPRDDQIGIRIGLASGLVFTVSDMNNRQNVWGPGIILARRVMDAGDNWHILLADNIAEQLISLKDEYRQIIKPISDFYEIKHGQKIRLYSAFSNDFGNPRLPTKVADIPE